MTRTEIIKKIKEKIKLYQRGESGLSATEMEDFIIDAFDAVYQAGRGEGNSAKDL